MRLHRAMLLGYSTCMGNEACAWENMDCAQMQKGINVHILCGGKLPSRVINIENPNHIPVEPY